MVLSGCCNIAWLLRSLIHPFCCMGTPRAALHDSQLKIILLSLIPSLRAELQFILVDWLPFANSRMVEPELSSSSRRETTCSTTPSSSHSFRQSHGTFVHQNFQGTDGTGVTGVCAQEKAPPPDLCFLTKTNSSELEQGLDSGLTLFCLREKKEETLHNVNVLLQCVCVCKPHTLLIGVYVCVLS